MNAAPTGHLRALAHPGQFPPLPVAWDSRPVRWAPWEPRARTTLDVHLKRSGECESCGSATSRWQSRGWYTDGGARHSYPPGARKRWVRDFHAERCGWCGHTTVYSLSAEQAWELDDTDYGPAGSLDPATVNTLF